MPEAPSDLPLVIDAVLAAGRAVMRAFGGEMDVTHKSPDQPLTESDLEADRILHERLLGARPEYGWLSEETADDPGRLRATRVWIVDPIDGTRSFIAGRPEFGISVGLAEDGRAVLGAILNPATGELYAAWRGGGAWKLEGAMAGRSGVGEWGSGGVGDDSGQFGYRFPRATGAGPSGGSDAGISAGAGAVPSSPPLPLPPSAPWRKLAVRQDSPDGRTVLASRSEIRDGEFEPFADIRVVPLGSTTYKLARLAEGAADVFLSRGPKSEWDLCAGALLVEEAGGVATDLRGQPVTYNGPDPRVYGILAAAPDLHAQVLARVRQLPVTARLARHAADPLHPGLEPEEDD